MAHNSAPSSPEDISDARPVVDTRPEILVLSSAIRDGLNHAMQPVNSTLESLTKMVVALQRKLLPPSHYGLGSGAIDVATPPSAFRRLGRLSSSLSRAPPSPLAELGVHTAPPSHAFAGLGAAPSPPPSRSGHGGIGPRHGLQPPSFFGLGQATEVPLEVNEQEPMGQGDDTLSIHASDAEGGHISEAEGADSTSQFAAFSQDIALPVEEEAPALPSVMADCFNSSFQGDLSGLAKIQTLLKSIQRPTNVDMKVKPTNKEIFTIRHGAMPSLRKADCALQNVQTTLVKSSYSMMKVAEDLVKAEKGSTIQSVLEAVTLNILALPTMDQLRRDKFLTILPHNLEGLAERPKGSHDHLFGDIKERQVEAKAKAEVVASLMLKPQKRPLSGLFANNSKWQMTTAGGTIETRGYTNPGRPSKNGQSFPKHKYPMGKQRYRRGKH